MTQVPVSEVEDKYKLTFAFYCVHLYGCEERSSDTHTGSMNGYCS